MTDYGKVVKTENNNAVIEILKTSECDGCKLCLFNKQNDTINFNIKNNAGLQVGDNVKIEISSKLSTVAVLIYLVPLAFAALGLLIGAAFNSELLMIIFALAALVIGFISLYFVQRILLKNKKLAIKVTKQITNDKLQIRSKK